MPQVEIMIDTPKERIAKVLANRGICSRRDAEKLILEGKVRVNNQLLTTPAFLVSPSDIIQVSGNLIPEVSLPKIWKFYKPPGLITTHKDPQNRPTVFSYIKEQFPALPRIISVGRLDINSEGLLLLTTDGELARYMESPQTGWIRHYRVRVFGKYTPSHLTKLQKPLIEGKKKYILDTVSLDSQSGLHSWFSVGLKQGKNREIRRIFEAADLQVSRLIRLSYGPFQLDSLKKGEIQEVPQKVLKNTFPPSFLKVKKCSVL